MRIKLAIVSGAVAVLLAGAGAAYAVVGHTAVSPTVTGNVLPIDSNHGTTVRPEPGDDRSATPTTTARAATASPNGSQKHRGGDDRPGHY